ncbi:hypothetical protein [Paenibacillus kandeliae]|uniref:hypothetical protein n=1 Tax=Paenibacillus kandeliae TaxID=3231269 RepID=UPI003457992D
MEAWQSSMWQYDPIVWIWPSVAMLALLAAVYGFSAAQRKRTDRERMRRIEVSLNHFTRAAGHLYPVVSATGNASPVSSSERSEAALTAEVVLACKSAPYADHELVERIDRYLEMQNRQALLLLYRTLEMNISRLTRERKQLLARGEQPHWGLLFWLTLRPLLPLLVLLLEGALLVHSWQALHIAQLTGPPAPFFVVLRLISLTGALLLLYGVLSAQFRESGRRTSFVINALIIAALGLLHLFGLMVAPYVLIVQVLVFAVGYRFTREPKRKERPYAGEYNK